MPNSKRTAKESCQVCSAVIETMPLKQGKTGHRMENINIWMCLNKFVLIL